jgi:effector-binding domain-containing protein
VKVIYGLAENGIGTAIPTYGVMAIGQGRAMEAGGCPVTGREAIMIGIISQGDGENDYKTFIMKKEILKLALCCLFIIGTSADQRAGTIPLLPIQQGVNDTIPVKITLDNTAFNDMNILFITDTAATTNRLTDVLGKAYGEIMQFVQQNQLQPLKFLAWYRSIQPPWIMDVAVEVNTIPEAVTGRIRARVQPGGEVLIAHILGPYDQVGQAYSAIGKWMNENHRQAKSASFEVYVNDPAAVKDPSEIQTDVYQPLESIHN